MGLKLWFSIRFIAAQGRYGEGFSKDEVFAAISNLGKNKINPWIQMVSNGFLASQLGFCSQ